MFDKMIKELKAKKGMKELSPMEKEVKMDLTKEMGGVAKDALRNQVKGLKKVTVASDSPEGLEEGLDKAKEIVESKEDESMEDESLEEPEMEESMDLSKIDEMIAKLEELKKKKMME